jgi:hypothetical protein
MLSKEWDETHRGFIPAEVDFSSFFACPWGLAPNGAHFGRRADCGLIIHLPK